MVRKQLKHRALCVAPALLVIAPGAAQAQSELPEIVVTAPSPILPPWEQRQSGPANGVGGINPDLRPIAERVFAPVTVVPRAEIERTPAAVIGDLIQNTPGVTGSTFAAGANRPIIRGLDNARVRMQENGLGSMDVSEIGEDHGVPIDPLAAQKIEVIRGPATLRWGSQAIGGVVSVENNRIPTPDTRMGLHGIIRGAFTSVDNGGEGAVVIDGRNGPFAVHGDFFRRNVQNYRTPLGVQANTWAKMTGASAGASYIFQNGYFGASLTHFASDYGVPGVEASAGRTHIDMRQTKFNSKGEVLVGSAFIDTIRYWYGASFYKHDERGLDLGIDTALATFKNREHEGRIEAQLQPFATGIGKLHTAIGVQFGIQGLRTGGEAGGLLPPADTSKYAAYIFNELHLTERTRLQAAARIESVRVKGTETIFPPGLLPDGLPLPEAARSRNFTPLSFSAGILHELPYGIVASFTAQSVERAPTPLELFSRGAHEASGTFEIGNPNLKIERAHSLEAGLRKAKGPLRFDFTLFHTGYQGYISKRLTSVLCGEDFDSCGVDTEFKQIFHTQRDARFTGMEFTSQHDLTTLGVGTLGVETQFDVVRARFSNGENIPRIPPVRVGGGVFWNGAGIFARLHLLHAFAQKRIDAAQETPTRGYNYLKAELSYRHKFKVAGAERELTVGLTGTNLLNAEMRNHSSFKKDEVLLPGRGVRLFASLRF